MRINFIKQSTMHSHGVLTASPGAVIALLANPDVSAAAVVPIEFFQRCSFLQPGSPVEEELDVFRGLLSGVSIMVDEVLVQLQRIGIRPASIGCHCL